MTLLQGLCGEEPVRKRVLGEPSLSAIPTKAWDASMGQSRTLQTGAPAS